MRGAAQPPIGGSRTMPAERRRLAPAEPHAILGRRTIPGSTVSGILRLTPAGLSDDGALRPTEGSARRPVIGWIRQLGAGGMAIVYLAHDLEHGRQVAF